MARIAGVDLPREKRVEIGLTYIYGIGRHTSNVMLEATGINPDTRVKDLDENDVAKLRNYIEHNYTVEGDLRKELVSKDLITYVEDRKGHDRRYAIAPDKIKAEIGWYPETMFKDGIKKTIAWFFENEEWMKNVTSGDYQKYYEEMYK